MSAEYFIGGMIGGFVSYILTAHFASVRYRQAVVEFQNTIMLQGNQHHHIVTGLIERMNAEAGLDTERQAP